MCCCICICLSFFFNQKTAYEMRISDWSSDVCSSDLLYHMTRKTEGPNPARFDDELVGENATKAPPEHQLLWFVGLIVTALLVGFFLAIGLFIDRKSTRLNSSH